MRYVDLNADLGESFGAYTLGMDEEVLKFITSANVACGFHAGDAVVMEKTARMAEEAGVAVGAHPGYPDLAGFGRREMGVTADEARAAYANLGGQACVLEKMLPLKLEVSAIVTRVSPALKTCFPVAENQHADGILDVSIVPARVAPELAERAQTMALRLADELDYVGVLAVECFVLEDDSLVVNEIAPRPHNSGHYTLDACMTDQFQQQVRAMCGLVPGVAGLLTPVVMVNLLGDSWQDNGAAPAWSVLMDAPNAKLHLYGKRMARPGRKMGHFSVTGPDVEALLGQARALQSTL